jgi:hypothetical protein
LFCAFPEGVTTTQPASSVMRYVTAVISIAANLATGVGWSAPAAAQGRNTWPFPKRESWEYPGPRDHQTLPLKKLRCPKSFRSWLFAELPPWQSPSQKKGATPHHGERLCSAEGNVAFAI